MNLEAGGHCLGMTHGEGGWRTVKADKVAAEIVQGEEIED